MELMFTTFALFIVTIVASYIFYQRIKMAQLEYDESKDTVRNITFGFTRQVRRMESELNRLEQETLQAKYLANAAINSKQENSVDTINLENVKELSERVTGIEDTIETMKKELTKIASQPRIIMPVTSSVDAPIPVKSEVILKELTETELDVLKLIVDFGEGSVPEIKEKIDKTREHTARLLKKLYDKGFIDRNTSGMPYKYSIRKEIRELILEQNESSKIGL